MNRLVPPLVAPFLLVSLGSSFSGAPIEEDHQRTPNVEVRVTFAPDVWDGRDYENGPGVEELCDSTKEALEVRFPWAEIDILDDAMRGIYEYRIRGASKLTELQLGLLGTAQPELNVLMAARPEDFAGEIDLAGEIKSAQSYLSLPRRDLAAYNASTNRGGAPEGLFFAWQTLEDGRRTLVPLFNGGAALNGSKQISVSRVFGARDTLDHPALGFEIGTADKVRRDAFIAENLGRELNVLIGTEILASPKVTTALSAGGLATRGAASFEESEVEFLLELLKAPRFPLRMRLLSVERL